MNTVLELAGPAPCCGYAERNILVVWKSLCANESFEFVPSGQFDGDVLVGEDIARKHPKQITFDLPINLIERVLSQGPLLSHRSRRAVGHPGAS
jgi:hypothetical protein